MTAATPGQALYEAFYPRDDDGFMPPGRLEWAVMPGTSQERFEAAAQAVLDSATEGSLRACGYTLGDIGRFLEAEAAAQEPHAAAEVAACGCPATDGKVYHQRGTCTDPVVAKLDWYADSGRIAAAPEAKPAPELAAAMAESRRYRDALHQVAKHIDSEHAQLRIVARIAKRALEGK